MAPTDGSSRGAVCTDSGNFHGNGGGDSVADLSTLLPVHQSGVEGVGLMTTGFKSLSLSLSFFFFLATS